jgi:hypothetical protein
VGVYLFYCDDVWKTMTDIYHEDLEQAIAQAEFEFGPIQFVSVADWRWCPCSIDPTRRGPRRRVDASPPVRETPVDES